ncbi:MAG: ion transporter [Gomphosphaeria aponina SAG 52.96 = DSM 107014]|uniref:Ion transporter n=1 Tax=Gomphosphaeria aponina SAG 52.96 = DSM 107014 TaxID=1521640 RepID=A0A941JUI7_9CHRO|nr:ion transporter [Gomphosphaeria aponina SAG 52.96 = DSM 107014]
MLLQEKISLYLEDIETPVGITINATILGLIILSLGIFVAETYPLSASLHSLFQIFDTIILIIFTIEYLIRFWCAQAKIKFLFSIFSLIDLIAILPLLIGFMDIRFIRIFRWFRLLRLLRIFEFQVDFLHLQREDSVIFTRILLTLFSIIFVYSGLIYQVENQINPENFSNFLDALYFSIVTMTTVGYGDITPLSESGKILTLLMILTGIALIPWQIGDLVKQLVKTANQTEKTCPGCGLSMHEIDANFCKICGSKLETIIKN